MHKHHFNIERRIVLNTAFTLINKAYYAWLMSLFFFFSRSLSLSLSLSLARHVDNMFEYSSQLIS